MYQNLKFVFALLLLVASNKVASQTYEGDLTYYTEWRDSYGSCGLDASMHDQFQVAALSISTWMVLPPGETNPNNHPLCAADKCIQLKGARGSVVLKISDSCAACVGNDVDVADTVFPLLDDPALGRVKVTWEFTDCSSNPPGQK